MLRVAVSIKYNCKRINQQQKKNTSIIDGFIHNFKGRKQCHQGIYAKAFINHELIYDLKKK